MKATRVPISKKTWLRFWGMLKALRRSPVGPKASLFAGLLIAFLFTINGLNVVNSYVGRDFMTSIESKELGRFFHYALLYVLVFAVATTAAVFYRYCEERLGLLWRKWLTERSIDKYMRDHIYYRMNAYGDLKNPDQRITEDIRSLAGTTLSFVLMILNASITVIAFSGVMWSISPLLLWVTILYAALGSVCTFYLGRPLIQLNYDQLDREANFRSRLVHVRENAESIALVRQEDRLRDRLHDRLDQLTANFRRIIDVNRNLGFFTTGYNYLIQIIPVLLVAPLFINGEAQFGVISQSAMAFGHLIGAFSLIVTQFQQISAYTAVIARLEALAEAVQHAAQPTSPTITYCTDCGLIAFDRLTLKSPRSGRLLVKELTASIPAKTRCLIRVTDEAARSALFRATAGLWDQGEGTITRPAADDILFLPERPYVPPGTLREVLLPGGGERRFSDERILVTLRRLNLVPAVQRAGGLDCEQNWSDLLSLGEQQLLAFARVLLAEPVFVFLDHPSRALSECQVDELLCLLCERGITYVTLGEQDEDTTLYDQLLNFDQHGDWTMAPPPNRLDDACCGVLVRSAQEQMDTDGDGTGTLLGDELRTA
ncbi:ABC transporter transmembrane domain-containing protein [uncultured Lamprocystis sp.]|jgi:putative ATP-binding cassette transporter|uniref:ABC transporter ATP-binding protein/permease n=1 Tax=uncultured Lamprocystis sp. TaxID=543132 RepID=UPI0025DC41CE|nr:ABC transporter transmembrane domain-containing protein [uncultured Lamprocystis sp.]